MSEERKPTITAKYEQDREFYELRRFCDLEVRRVPTQPVGVNLRVEFDEGDQEAALEALDEACEDVRRQIERMRDMAWPTPRAEGEESP